MEQILPKINTEELQEKANEFAQKGAVDTLKDFYMGYNSPYKKAIEESLKGKGVSVHLDLPDVIGKLNELISDEVDKIANTAVSKTFLPIVTKTLTRSPKECLLSDIMKDFIKDMDFDPNEDDYSNYTIEIYDRYENDHILSGSFLNVTISDSDKTYDLGLNNQTKYKKDSPTVYTLMNLPENEHKNGRYNQTMKLSLEDGGSLEIPFVPNVLSDPFVSHCAGLVLANTLITIDVKEFDEDMFPERDNCHC